MTDTTNTKIAVIGMACRFPGANGLAEFWNNLIEGKDTIRHFTDEELGKYEPDYNNLRTNPHYVKARGVLDNIDKFDAPFFGMNTKEATDTDPQHRVWLETAWEAFESANCDPLTYNGAIGVFAGGNSSTYLLNNILRDPMVLENYIRLRSAESYQLLTANDSTFLSTKTAYKFNLKGPAVFVNTACSTSMVAITHACQSLYCYESDVCLAGGVSIVVPQESGYIYQDGAIPSPDGRCRPFDAQAKGTVSSNGVGAVVLKRLEDAERDNDRIFAVISGWALNNDGSNKVSYTAPSIDGQAEVIKMAHFFAEVSPDDISYVEAHGTATKLGDPIEVAALTKAFSAKTDRKQFCGLGSVKSNIGHTDSAAGVASFIKTCLASYFKLIPPSLNYNEPNPLIDFKNSPFYVVNEVKKWTENRPLIMGVSSFGIGGTNSHLIIEEAPKAQEKFKMASAWPALIMLSAKSEYSLGKKKEDIIEYLKINTQTNLIDVAYTLEKGRTHMPLRSIVVASDVAQISEGKASFIDGVKDSLVSRIAFMYPGQGAQYIGMGKELYQKEVIFRTILDEAFGIILSETGNDLKAILFSEDVDTAEKQLSSTELTQPSLFIIEYALTKLLDNFGIKPDCLIGHSIGEYAAACVAGVFDFKTALKIVCKRGELMSKMPPGGMYAVMTSVEELKNISHSCFEIAADNSSSFCTISFRFEDQEQVKAILEKSGLKYVSLNISHAFHSAAFNPIVEEFAEFVNQFTLHIPEIPFISCLTGEYISDAEATSGTYWAQQLRNTVLFRQGVSAIGKNSDTLFLEVGPNTHLSSLVRQNTDILNKKLIISTLGKPDEISDQVKVLTALGKMFIIGMNIDYSCLADGVDIQKIDLPAYPFDRKRHWKDFSIANMAIPGKDSYNGNIQPASTDGDRQAELADDQDMRTSEDKFVADLNPVERKIYDIWCEAFMTKEISVTDNFFEIGGTSLMAITVMTKIETAFNKDLGLKVFFDSPTIKEIAEIINISAILPGIHKGEVRASTIGSRIVSGEI